MEMGDRIVEALLQLSNAVDLLTEKVAELERKIALLTQDSSNSSNPPSSDGPAIKPGIRRRKKSRHLKPGGQAGHKGTNRDLVPIEKVVLIEEVLPESCEICHKPFYPGVDASRLLGNPQIPTHLLDTLFP